MREYVGHFANFCWRLTHFRVFSTLGEWGFREGPYSEVVEIESIRVSDQPLFHRPPKD